jgi:poly-gamma-glutamate synthase PgsB/CapB
MFTDYSINGYWLLLVLTILIIIHLFIEIYRHRQRLFKIQYRIHVNGTRGKSSVARLIAAGLRAGQLTTVCKTTGTMARFIMPDGEEEPIYRIGRTNIIEQVKVVKKAAKYKPQALVIECMAVQPLLQSLCELRLVRSTHGVCVNARADHLDVMGPTERDVALALAGTMTINGQFYTPEKKHLDVFKMAAKDRNSQLIHISDSDISAVSDEEIKRFRYSEYKDNVALALKVCEACGINREVALEGMWEATPDPGALTVFTIDYKDKKITFANGFAANDPESTEALWHKIINEYPDADGLVAVVNCRVDRGDRSRQMAESIVDWQKPQLMLAIGSGTDYFLKPLDKSKLNGVELVDGQEWGVEKILDTMISTHDSHHILAIGVCNIAQIGFELVNYFSHHEEQQQ